MKGYMSRYKFLPSFYEQLVSSCFSFLSWYLVTCSLLNINTRKVCCLSSEDITVKIDQIDGRNWFNLCRRCVLRLNGCYVAGFNIPADYNLPFALELLKWNFKKQYFTNAISLYLYKKINTICEYWMATECLLHCQFGIPVLLFYFDNNSICKSDEVRFEESLCIATFRLSTYHQLFRTRLTLTNK